MATKRINFNNLTTETVFTLSNYNIALQSLRLLRDDYKEKKSALEEKKSAILSQREKAIADGVNTDKAISENSLAEVVKELNALEVNYKDKCKPYKDAQKICLDMIDENLYLGYILSQKNGSLKAKGRVEVKKGKKVEYYQLDNSYTDMIKAYLVELGCGNTTDDKALNKFANIMATRTSGMIKSMKADYVKTKSTTQYKELFMLNLLQYLVIDLKVLVENADTKELTKRVYK